MDKELKYINNIFPNLLEPEGDFIHIDTDIFFSLNKENISLLLSNKPFYKLFEKLISTYPYLIDELPSELVDESMLLLAINGMLDDHHQDFYWDEIFSALKILLKNDPFFIKRIINNIKSIREENHSYLEGTSFGFRLLSSVDLEVWKDKDTALSLLEIGACCFIPLNTNTQDTYNSLTGEYYGIYGNDGWYYHWSRFVKINTLKDILRQNGYLEIESFNNLFYIIETAVKQNLSNLQSDLKKNMISWVEDEDLIYKFGVIKSNL